MVPSSIILNFCITNSRLIPFMDIGKVLMEQAKHLLLRYLFMRVVGEKRFVGVFCRVNKK